MHAASCGTRCLVTGTENTTHSIFILEQTNGGVESCNLPHEANHTLFQEHKATHSTARHAMHTEIQLTAAARSAVKGVA
jgi:hypothetical protein